MRPAGSIGTAVTRLRSLNLVSLVSAEQNLGQPRDPDVLWIEQRIDVSRLEEARRVKRHGGRVVYDCCDSGSALGYWASPASIVEMMALADLVVTDTPERARWIRLALRCGPIRVIENPADCNPLLEIPNLQEAKSHFRICWHGYSGNLSSLARYADVLRGIPDVVLVTIGASVEDVRRYLPDLKAEMYPWDLTTFSSILQSCHLCFLSHEGGWHSRMKSGHKMATAIGLGVPVVASATPDYQRMAARLGVPQAIVKSPEMLHRQLLSLRTTAARAAYLQSALPAVREWYAPDVFRAHLIDLLEDLVTMKPRSYSYSRVSNACRHLYSRFLFSPPFR